MSYTIEEIKEILKQYISEDYWDFGCFVDGNWLSVNDIIEMIERG